LQHDEVMCADLLSVLLAEYFLLLSWYADVEHSMPSTELDNHHLLSTLMWDGEKEHCMIETDAKQVLSFHNRNSFYT
jgi:hypothetical protein